MKKFLITSIMAVLCTCCCIAQEEPLKVQDKFEKNFCRVYEWIQKIGEEFVPEAKDPLKICFDDYSKVDELFEKKKPDATKSIYSYECKMLKDGKGYRVFLSKGLVCITYEGIEIYLGKLRASQIPAGITPEIKTLPIKVLKEGGEEVYSGEIEVSFIGSKKLKLKEIKIVHRSYQDSESGSSSSNSNNDAGGDDITSKMNHYLCRSFLKMDGKKADVSQKVILCPEDNEGEKVDKAGQNELDRYGWSYHVTTKFTYDGPPDSTGDKKDSIVEYVRILYRSNEGQNSLPFYQTEVVLQKDEGKKGRVPTVQIFLGVIEVPGKATKPARCLVELQDKEGKKVFSEKVALTVVGDKRDIVDAALLPKLISLKYNSPY